MQRPHREYSKCFEQRENGWASAVKRSAHIEMGEISTIEADAMVNASNSSLRMGTGVDKAIRLAAGPEPQKECDGLGGCETGASVATRAYNLAAKCIIHTV